MTNDTSLESSYMLCFKNLQKKIANFFLEKSGYEVKCLPKKFTKTEKIYIFEKPLTMPLLNMQKSFAKFLIN